ncbi:S8 family peptidase [Hephaestia caeni]|nr:S8 family peptidase [Hephaestia caeni]
MNALAAYQEGATGAGVKVGVIDSGIDLQSQEFPGRIDPASVDVAATRGLDDQGGHGTAVAFTIAGRRNGAGTHGVAFDSTLLVMRADAPGSCTTTGDDGGCTFDDDAIARGVDRVATNGARVINISLGGEAASPELVDAIRRATQQGVIIVISAGNDATPNPDPLAAVATTDAAHGMVIIAGSVGAADTLSDFSDKAGNGAAHYLAAVGEGVRAPDQNDTPFIWSGTSFAAPQIAGAVALLAQAFPNLSGAQIIQILYDSARDVGAPGVDSVYGHGVLDLTHAFQPLGGSSIAGTPSAVSLTTNATLSTPMGDAAQTGLGAVILDGFDRAFAIDLAHTIDTSGLAPTLTGALSTRERRLAGTLGATMVSLTIAPGAPMPSIVPTRLSPDDARQARAIAGLVTSRLGGEARFAIGFARSSATLTAQLAGRTEPAFLVASDPTREQGFASDIGGSAAIRQPFGGWGVTAAAESGAVLNRNDGALPAIADRYRRTGYDRFSIGIDRRVGALGATAAVARLDERDSVLGARFGGALGANRATSWFVDAGARWDAGGGWSVGGAMRLGWTRAEVRGGLDGAGRIHTSAFAADIGKQGVFGDDTVGLRIAQPLRVAKGGIDLTLPTHWDYATLAVDRWTTQRLNLAPTGREIDIEARYGRWLGAGWLDTNVFWRRDPANIADLPDDYGAAMRYSLNF